MNANNVSTIDSNFVSCFRKTSQLVNDRFVFRVKQIFICSNQNQIRIFNFELGSAKSNLTLATVATFLFCFFMATTSDQDT